MKNRCKQCVFFDQSPYPFHDQGLCRRHAPGPDGWTTVSADDWCGDGAFAITIDDDDENQEKEEAR